MTRVSAAGASAEAPAANPLPACPPRASNCARTSVPFEATPERVFEAAVAALRSASGPMIGRAESVTEDAPRLHADAVFLTFGFRDDVAIRVVPEGAGAVLHVRSASRVGRSDLGVNGRRVRAVVAEAGRALAR